MEKYYAGTAIIEKPITELKKLDFDEWAHNLIKDNNMTKKVYYNTTVIMRQSLDYAVDKEIVSDNLFRKVRIDGKRLFRKVRKPKSHTQVFNQLELDSIEKMAWEEYRNKSRKWELSPLGLLFLFQTGLRIGELCALRYSDIEGDIFHVERMVREETKELLDYTKTENGDREVILTSKAKALINEARKRQDELGLSPDNYIFSHLENVPITQDSVRRMFEKYCRELDIVRKTSHKARKTYISALVDGGLNINTIREMVGHADEKTTYGNYVFDRSLESERKTLLEKALG